MSGAALRRAGAWTALLAALAAGAAGCNILAPAAYLIGGLPKVEAQYELVNRPTVVFVDDRANVISSNARVLRLAVADIASRDLMTNEVLLPETTISPRDALGLVLAQDRHSELMPIDAIGRAVGAEQIIYVEMLGFRDSPDGVSPRPVASCRVRVLDVEKRERLFPPPDSVESGVTVGAMLQAVNPDVFRSASARLRVHRQLAEMLGEEVAKLFYRHESRDLGERLTPR